MCIAIFSTAHPSYPLIAINNRDEHLDRPTAPASWWEPPNAHVLGGRDLQRDVRGTWLGTTRDGRIAVLTNFREERAAAPGGGAASRGAMVNSYLTQRPADVADTAGFVRGLVGGEGARGAGGFSLVCGKMGGALAVVSNRTPDAAGVAWIGGGRGQTVGLSNAAFGDRSWPKVAGGERLMERVVEGHAARGGSEEQLLEELFALLSTDTLPGRKAGDGLPTFVGELRKSIFIPGIGGEEEREPAEVLAAASDDRPISVGRAAAGAYGTQKQTIVLLDRRRHVTFVEKTLYADGRHVADSPESVRTFEYLIE